MGCMLNELPGHLEGPDGAHPIRYLYSPLTDDFVSLLNYESDELVPPSDIEGWERRLRYDSASAGIRRGRSLATPAGEILFGMKSSPGKSRLQFSTGHVYSVGTRCSMDGTCR